MEPLISRLFAHAAPRAGRSCIYTGIPHSGHSKQLSPAHLGVASKRCITTGAQRAAERGDKKKKAEEIPPATQETSHNQPAHKLSQNVTEEEKQHYDKLLEHSKEKQIRSPWTREGSDKPPVARQRSAGAMTKGKLLTTPSRMLKLILPLTTRDVNQDRKDVEPLALLVHPQQPLSYLERLIQSELPPIQEGNRERIPSVYFRAEDSAEEDEIDPDKAAASKSAEHGELAEHDDIHTEEHDISDADFVRVDGKLERTGKLNKKTESARAENAAVRDPEHPNFVRWSPSTEIGDFIRDAARGREFSVDIEGTPSPIYVGVPSFADRTYYLRMRLRKIARQISSMADLKQECDKLAHRGAQRVAQGGFAILVGWWYLVYRLTFETDLGWDVMEPVTYLVGLSTLIGGYMWFLYHNREVSYRSAMNFTVSRRQSKLYEQRGFDLAKWESLVEEGNRLRREIKMVADEYDVEWDETKDSGDEKVAEALRKERQKKKNGGKEKKDSKDVDDDDE